MWALRNMREAVMTPRNEEDLKRVYQKFIDSVEVFEGYVTVALDVFSMMGYRRRMPITGHEKRPPLDFHQMVTWNGGAEGNRTPVRKQLGRNFSGRSLLFTFPLTVGNKHSTVISSFMMHGTLKALRTHGLHSNHTLARLVDLPGRMGRLIRQPEQRFCCQLNLKSYPFYRGQVPRPAYPASLPPSKPVQPHIEGNREK